MIDAFFSYFMQGAIAFLCILASIGILQLGAYCVLGSVVEHTVKSSIRADVFQFE